MPAAIVVRKCGNGQSVMGGNAVQVMVNALVLVLFVSKLVVPMSTVAKGLVL